MKKLSVIVALVLVTIVMALCGCASQSMSYDEIVAYSFWKNKGNEAIAEYQTYHIINDFLSDGELKDGKVVSPEGKVKKVAFLGLDGVRADAMLNIMHDDNKFESNSYSDRADYSGIGDLASQGGLYLAYCGGDDKASKQSTSTCAGWTTHLTGSWSDVHGVKENSDIKKENVDSIMLKYAKLGLNTSLAFDWGDLFDITFRHEVKWAMENSNYTICDIDRKAKGTVAEALVQERQKAKDKLRAVNLDYYNAVANPNVSASSPYDSAMRDYLISRIAADDDIVAGIFHNPDSNGHTDGFSNGNNTYVNSIRNANNYVYELMQIIAEREATMNEEWLIISTADHGGIDRGHGGQTIDERTIWIASNNAIDAKFYSTEYKGKMYK